MGSQCQQTTEFEVYLISKLAWDLDLQGMNKDYIFNNGGPRYVKV